MITYPLGMPYMVMEGQNGISGRLEVGETVPIHIIFVAGLITKKEFIYLIAKRIYLFSPFFLSIHQIFLILSICLLNILSQHHTIHF